MMNFWVWKLREGKIFSYSPNAEGVLCFAEIACENICKEFGVVHQTRFFVNWRMEE